MEKESPLSTKPVNSIPDTSYASPFLNLPNSVINLLTESGLAAIRIAAASSSILLPYKPDVAIFTLSITLLNLLKPMSSHLSIIIFRFCALVNSVEFIAALTCSLVRLVPVGVKIPEPSVLPCR